MAENSLKAGSVRLLDVLEQGVVLRCPLFQRGYRWKKPEIDLLWTDIDTLRDGQYDVRFLGALVFDADDEARANYAPTKWIIDGQQRLTTLYMALTAIAIRLAEIAEGVEDAHDLVNDYLVGSRKNVRRRPKLVPTIPDYAQFDQVLEPLRSLPVERLAGAQQGIGGRMVDGMRLVQEAVDARADAETPSEKKAQLVELRDVILERLEFVEIILGDDHDANEVFDRLNKSGQPLGLLDLIRNDVMRWSMKDPDVAQHLYDNAWLPFEQGFSEQTREGYFWPYSLCVNPTTTKSRTFHDLVKYWRTLIAELPDDATAEETTMAIIEDLRVFQPAYLALREGKRPDAIAEKSKLWEVIRRLNRSDPPGVTLPYLMQAITAAIAGDCEHDTVAASLSVIESFLVRRAVVGLEPTGLHAIFKKLWAAAGADPAAVRENLTSATIRYPTDSEFHEALVYGPLYRRRVARYVLSERERAITTGDVLTELPEFEIDHILPRNPTPDSKCWSAWSEVEHEQLVDTFANLVPMTKSGNIEKSNADWDDVREWLKGHTAFKQASDVYLTYTQWTPADVLRRAGGLADWAVQRWP